MADEPAPDPLKNLYFFLSILVLLVILWYASGGPSRADLRGIFLNPPPPVGNGGAYGPNPQPENPQFETGTVTAPEQVPQYHY